MCDDDPKFYIESSRRDPVVIPPVVPTTAMLTTRSFFTEQLQGSASTTTSTPVDTIRFSLDDTSSNAPDRCGATFVPLNMDDANLDELLNFLKSRRVDNLGDKPTLNCHNP